MPEIFYWIWLSLKTTVSHRSLRALLQYYGSPDKAYNAPKGEFARIRGISPRDAELLEERDPEKLLRVYTDCRDKGIEIIPLNSEKYPERLKNIYYPPAVLYVRGRLPSIDDNPAIAVIGTRRCTPYGLKMGRNIARDVASRGAVVISGLTKGIDAAAAEGALSAGGLCIGVLGTAIDACEGGLYDEVTVNGALVSEYAPGTESSRQYFRARNRVSAGFCVGVVVVESPEKSGTRYFVDDALEQGKDIFAVPGNADSPNSIGTLKMIAQGAKPVANGTDVLAEYIFSYAGALHEPVINKPEPRNAVSGTAGETPVSKPEAPAASAHIDLSDPALKLNDDQKKVIGILNDHEASADELIARTGLPAYRLLSMLTILEIKGLVAKKPGNLISINPKHK